jgi:hypothetical protein
MFLVLIHDDSPTGGFVHACVKKPAGETICGQKCHPASSTYTPELFVTCQKCLDKLDSGQLKEQLRMAKKHLNAVLLAGSRYGLRIDVAIDTHMDDSATIDFRFTKEKKPSSITMQGKVIF